MAKVKHQYWNADGTPTAPPPPPPTAKVKTYSWSTRQRCIYCKTKLKSVPGSLGWKRATTCKKCGRDQPWAEAV